MPTSGPQRAKGVFVLILLLGLGSALVGQIPGRRPVVPPPPDLDMILAYVTVTSSKGSAPRLSAADFQILEDNKPQKIDYFAVQDQPATVGILWGAGTGTDAEHDVRECPRVFMKNMVVGSEYFILSGDTVTTAFTTDIRKIPKLFPLSGANPDTAFIGLDVLKESANSRKMLLIVTTLTAGTGGQLNPAYVERATIRQGYQVHALVFDPGGAEANNEGQIFLNELVELTGGSYTLAQPSTVICEQLAEELRVQYMIGFHPTNAAKDGKWRKLGVKLNASLDGSKLKARIKRGYYAAKESR